MNPNQKQAILKHALPILGVIIKELFKGKTKVGVYVLGLTTLTLKFFLDVPVEVAAVEPNVVPTVAKAALTFGTGALGIGIVHDLIKKGKGIVKGISEVIKIF